MPIHPDGTVELRGFDSEGHKVIVGWKNADGSEYLIALTRCCEAAVSIFEDGTTYCKACYGDADPLLGAEGRVKVPVYTLAELEAMETIEVGYTDDLKIRTEWFKVWLARTDTKDGEPCDHKVTVEYYLAGKWEEVGWYEAAA